MLNNTALPARPNAQMLADRGAVAGEYAVLLALIGIALVTVIGFFTNGIVNQFQIIINILP